MRIAFRNYTHLCVSIALIVLLVVPIWVLRSHSSPSNASNLGSQTFSNLKYKAVQEYASILENEVKRLEALEQKTPTTHATSSSPSTALEKLLPKSPTSLLAATSAPAVSTLPPSASLRGIISNIDPDFLQWKASLASKLVCQAKRHAILYHYHVRKAAGTSIRDSIKLSARLSMIAYVETEGVVLDPSILSTPGLLSITSLRDPISRILSLYWYEHVGWYSGVLKQPQRCKPLREWIQAWTDGSPLKESILTSNPRSNYVEVENYYVKMLTGWDGKRKLTADDLEKAKAVLRQFDVVLISEWMGDETQLDAFRAIFKGQRKVSIGHKVAGDKKMRANLERMLSPDEEKIKQTLRRMNALDIQLYEYAQSLVALRLKEIVPLVEASAMEAIRAPAIPANCAMDAVQTVNKYRSLFGLFQPKGHKGP